MNQQIAQTNKINFAPTLEKDEKDFILAGTGKKIKDLTKSEICQKLAEILPKAIFDAGQSSDKLKLAGTINSVYPDLAKYFSNLTIDDISHAFHLGVRKQYGDYMGINPVTIFQWLKGYVQDAKRAEAKKKQSAYLDSINKPKELTQEQKDEIMNEAIKKAFDLVRSGNKYDDIGNAIYNHLDKKGLIKFTKERKEQIMIIAKKNCKEHFLNKLHLTKQQHEKNIIKEKMHMIEIENIPEAIIEAKKIALNQFIQECIDMEIDLC